MINGSCVFLCCWRVFYRDCVSYNVRNPGLKNDIPKNTREMKPDRFLATIPPLNSSLTVAIFVWSGKEQQAIHIMESKSVLDPLFSK